MDGLTPDARVFRAVTERYGALWDRLGDEVGDRPLVLPNEDFFPDTFTGDARSAKRLVKRMRRHAGMTDIPLRVEVLGLEEQEEAKGGGCGSGSCGLPAATSETNKPRLEEDGEDGWIMRIPAPELRHPVVLTSNVAVALGHILLLECLDEDEGVDGRQVAAELSAVALGFGVLLLEGSYIYAKSCGGPSVAQATKLSCPELSVATALFISRSKKPKTAARGALGELSTTQKAAFKAARSLLKANPSVVEALRERPEQLATGAFSIKDPTEGGFRLRSSKADPESLEEMEALAAQLGPMPAAARKKKKRDPKEDELSSLVAEALSMSHADAE